MTDLFKQFDAYSLKARVFPALIAALPTLALLVVLVPWDDLGLPHLTAAATGLVLLFAFADLGRRTGRHVQAKLGTGATPEQWHRGNSDVPEGAKDRYRAFLAKQIGSPEPSVADERSDPQGADDFYLSANGWLRERTRDTRAFAILFGENVTYGFRRNLLGLRPIALVCNAVVGCVCAAILVFKPAYFTALPHMDEKMVAILAAVVLHSAYMLFAVTPGGVRDASRAYGRQLILSCETLMGKPAPKAKGKTDGDR